MISPVAREEDAMGKTIRAVNLPLPGQHSIERWGWGSIALNLVLAILNLGISIASGSFAVVAEMVHNLVDLVGSVAVLAGLKIAGHHSRAFPYGLYKVENVVSVLVSGLIFLTAFDMIHIALSGSPRTLTVRPWMLFGVALSAIGPLVFSYFQLKAGRRSNSPSLISSAREYQTHVFSSGIVLIALLGQLVGLPIDRWAALVVVFFIIRTGWELLRDGMRVLLDASLDKPTLELVKAIIESDPATANVKSLTGRNSGRYRFLEAELELHSNDLQKAHAVSERIEHAIRERVPHVERVLIHYEPAAHKLLRYAFPLVAEDGTLSEHFGEAPYFAFVTLRVADKLIRKQELLPNPFRLEAKAKGIKVAEWLVSRKVDIVFTREDLKGKGPQYVLENAGVEISTFDENTLDSALKKIKEEAAQSVDVR